MAQHPQPPQLYAYRTHAEIISKIIDGTIELISPAALINTRSPQPKIAQPPPPPQLNENLTLEKIRAMSIEELLDSIPSFNFNKIQSPYDPNRLPEITLNYYENPIPSYFFSALLSGIKKGAISIMSNLPWSYRSGPEVVAQLAPIPAPTALSL